MMNFDRFILISNLCKNSSKNYLRNLKLPNKSIKDRLDTFVSSFSFTKRSKEKSFLLRFLNLYIFLDLIIKKKEEINISTDVYEKFLNAQIGYLAKIETSDLAIYFIESEEVEIVQLETAFLEKICENKRVFVICIDDFSEISHEEICFNVYSNKPNIRNKRFKNQLGYKKINLVDTKKCHCFVYNTIYDFPSKCATCFLSNKNCV